MKGAYLGPAVHRPTEIERYLERRRTPLRAARPRAAARHASRGMLADEKIVGWFDGRMEFGPRALGAAASSAIRAARACRPT